MVPAATPCHLHAVCGIACLVTPHRSLPTDATSLAEPFDPARRARRKENIPQSTIDAIHVIDTNAETQIIDHSEVIAKGLQNLHDGSKGSTGRNLDQHVRSMPVHGIDHALNHCHFGVFGIDLH
jgi:hypothetical protein